MLDFNQLYRVAPSIFSDEPSDKMSSKYQMIKTYDIVKAFDNIGYVPVQAGQTKTRISGRQYHTKHMIRFRHKDLLGRNQGEVIDGLLWNAHDGTSCYRLELGVFRFVCSNGLVRKSEDLGSLRVRHKGNHVIEEVVESMKYLETEIPRLEEYIERWKTTPLTAEDQKVYAENIMRCRYETLDKAPFTVSELLNVRRYEDGNPTLWNTFNVCQENIMRGGLSAGFKGEKRVRTSRPIRGVSETIRFNQAAWQVTEDTYNKLLETV